MSRTTKRKHVLREAFLDDYSLPTENQQIVKILRTRGSNLHEVLSANNSVFLASMPPKFRKNIWVKRGDFVLVESIKEGFKVKAEMVRILTQVHIKYFKTDGVWPSAFDNSVSVKDKHDVLVEDELFVNTNRKQFIEESDSSSADSSSEEE